VDWRIVAGVASALALLFTAQNYLSPSITRGSSSLLRTFTLQVIVWVSWIVVSPLVFAAARRWRRHQRLSPSIVASQVLTSVGVAMLQAMLAGTLRWITGMSVTEDLSLVLINSAISNLGSNLLRYWLIASAYHAVAYHREVRDREVHAARLQGSLAQAKLESLQGRLHPHFLFNTLNSIGALIRDDPASAEQMLGALSDLLRASLHAEPSREVTLERELDLVRQYVSIQQMRFQDRLHVSIEAGPDVLNAYVPHLVLQPLVENAIRHGIAPREGPGHVRIAAGRTGERLRLIVEDDGVGLTEAQRGIGGFGLSGTEARLEHLYGGRASLDVCSRVPSGIVATVDLPYHTSPVASAV
jgi:sensor histidine kinase YesM